MYQKLWSHNVQFLRYVARQTDERTEKVTYRGRCLTKKVGKHHSSNYIPIFKYELHLQCSTYSRAALLQSNITIIIPNNTLCFAAVLTASFKVNFIISFGQCLQFYCIMIWKIYVLHKWIYIHSRKWVKELNMIQ